MTQADLNPLYSDPLGTAHKAAAEISRLTGVEKHDIGLVMGSGWVGALDALGEPTHEFNADDVIGFLPPTVVGHSGKIRSYLLGEVRALVFLGCGLSVDRPCGPPAYNRPRRHWPPDQSAGCPCPLS